MDLNLNDFLRAVANALDTIEIAIFGMPTNHSKRIAYISVKIARELQLTNEEIFDLASLAIMHDNGASMKILNDKLLGTTKEKMNLMESRKGHCTIGEDNIKNFPFFTNPKNIIKYHHEKYDGSGYPEGLTVKDLDFNSRLMTCLDIYQALREDRPYRKSMAHREAMEILRSMVEAGQLDSIIVADINSVFANR